MTYDLKELVSNCIDYICISVPFIVAIILVGLFNNINVLYGSSEINASNLFVVSSILVIGLQLWVVMYYIITEIFEYIKIRNGNNYENIDFN